MYKGMKRETSKRLGIISCSILRMELTELLRKLNWQPEVIYLD